MSGFEGRAKKGEVRNPYGRPKIPKEYREIRKLNNFHVQMMLNKYLGMPITELQKLQGRDDIPMLELFIISMIQKGIKERGHEAWKTIMDYTIGMLPRPYVVKKIEDDTPRDVIPIQMSKDEKLKMIDRLRDKVNAEGESSETRDNQNEGLISRETTSEISERNED